MGHHNDLERYQKEVFASAKRSGVDALWLAWLIVEETKRYLMELDDLRVALAGALIDLGPHAMDEVEILRILGPYPSVSLETIEQRRKVNLGRIRMATQSPTDQAN